MERPNFLLVISKAKSRHPQPVIRILLKSMAGGGLRFGIFLWISGLRWATGKTKFPDFASAARGNSVNGKGQLPAFFRLWQSKISQPQGREFLILISHLEFFFSRFFALFRGFWRFPKPKGGNSSQLSSNFFFFF